jgi:hypothetical protein
MNITVALRREIKKLGMLADKIEVRKGQIERALKALTTGGKRKKFKMSAASRKKIGDARRKYWADRRRNEKKTEKK